MPQMPTTIGAMFFRAWDEKDKIRRIAQSFIVDRFEKAGPTCTTVEFMLGGKERMIASRTVEYAFALFVI